MRAPLPHHLAAASGIRTRIWQYFFLIFFLELAHYLTISIDDARDPVLHTAPPVSSVEV
jgi:hypothetical protein